MTLSVGSPGVRSIDGSIQENADGSQTESSYGVSNGEVVFTETKNVDPNGVASEVATGSGAQISADSETIQASNANVEIFGEDNTISQGNNTGSTTYLQGTGNHVTDDSGNDTANVVGDGSQAQIDGDAVGNMLGNNEQINSTGVGFTSAAANGTSGDTFFGNASTVYFGSGTTGSLALGNSNTVVGGDNTGSSFSVSGQNLTVGGVSGNNTLLVDSGSSSATIYGNGTVISTADNQTIRDMGDGGSVRVADGVTGDVIYADHASVYEGENDQVQVMGQDDSVYGNATDTNTGDQEGYTGSGGYSSSGGGGYAPPPYEPPPYYPPGGGGYYGGGYGGYDFAAGASALKASNNTLGTIAAFDKTIGDTVGEATANVARAQATLAMSLTGAAGAATTAGVTGLEWQPAAAADGSRTITWSFAAGAAGASDAFSSFIGAQYQSTIEQALQAWSNATGLTFQQVADSPSANIRLGFGDFATATSGVLGYTDAQASASTGTIQSAVIRLEDPLESALSSTGTDGTYAGTGATLYQVALHEVGRALGFADNADPDSVMYATASSSNQTLDATDLAGAALVYGGAAAVTAETAATTAAMPQASGAAASTPTTTAAAPLAGVADAVSGAASGVNQLVQAMATFAPQQPSGVLAPIAAQNAAVATQLAAPLHG